MGNKELQELSDGVMELTEMFDDCPPMQAIFHGAFALYLYGDEGLIRLVLLAASMGQMLDDLKGENDE